VADEEFISDDHHQPMVHSGGPVRALFTFRASEQSVRATEPLVIFTDAILSIAATVLVFQLSIPSHLGPQALRRILIGEWPTFAAIFVGYLFLASSWLNTRRLRRMLRGVDHYATVLYLIMILTIAFIPFMMLVLARSFGQPDFSVGVQVLAGISFVDGVFATGLLQYCSWRGLGGPHMSAQAWKEVLVPNYILTALDLVSIFAAHWAPWPVLVFITADWLYALLPLFTDRIGFPQGQQDAGISART
jgi:uncharacterized membrane protein